MKNIVTRFRQIYNRNNYLFIPVFLLLLFMMSASAAAQTKEDCMMCHDDKDMTMEKNGRELSLYVDDNVLNRSIHKNLNCVTCHTGFDPFEIPHKENIQPIDCKTCHSDAPVKHQFHPQMMKAVRSNGSPDVSCKGCHGTHNVISTKQTASRFHASKLTESCGSCHKDVKDKFIHSSHWSSVQQGLKGSPTCLTCHKSAISSSSNEGDTLKIKIAQEKLCLSCHLDDPDIRSRTTPSAGFIQAYELSVHGSSLLGGNTKAAGCIDCHNSHDVLHGNNLNSSVNRLNIPATCGYCHTQITEEFNESIHGVSAMKGNRESPVCTDCHGEHNILRADDPLSPVSFQRVSAEICAPCHTSLRLSDKYGITTDRFQSFTDSYHGLAIRGGSLEVANCASCHGVHDIKPSTDPTSMIHPSNIAETCGSCHPGANERFAVGRIHVTMDKEDDTILYWIAFVYIIMIVVIIGGMFIHNILDFIRKAKIKRLKQRGIIKHESHGHALYLRMTLNERIQHGTMALSFIVLVITGFMLSYPDSWWVRHIRDISEDAFVWRSLIHRIAAVVMVAISLYHIYYLSFTRRGRQLLFDLMPRLQDVKDAIGVFKFNIGISSVKPKLGRFSYIEKSEYWALVWGTLIMTVTGVIMWFNNYFMGLLSKLGWDVARTIHYYEAWLAFLAIVVWHFYFVMFNPDVYPMNLAWLRGTITEEEMADEHPLELEEYKKQKESKPDTEKTED